ncbi:extracellular solute-binding protein [candidate division KSB3 bacterium]|uniref:Extracellular solute-binding protein n=1 Tax=candidate division KSB3 bacterium TaxID=2044937 RepID=A0A9D5K0D3_9BACT|nr:extracellular solute-binding protein [candidate division KSB3 bacterium]MBD3327574.1 extracellular solute-binding protein [candidate division KSB3 bacterium]
MKSMKQTCLVLALTVMMAITLTTAALAAEEVKLTYWTHWCSNGDYEYFWPKAAEQFNAEHPDVDFEFELVCVPYEGYEAKYTSAFQAGKGPDLFNGMPHTWAGQYGAADPMPADIAESLEQVLVKPAQEWGLFNGVRYGMPYEGGNFMMMFINTDMFVEAGLDPDDPPETFDELLEYAKKLTKYDEQGNITQAGYGIRWKGHPFGIADKAMPFVHAWGGQLLSWDEKKASGYVNSPESVAGIEFYGELVNEHKVASIEVDNPVGMFAQGLAGIIFRESWLPGWLQKNAPHINYKVYPMPVAAMEPGVYTSFAWAIMVNKNAPEANKKWAWEFFKWYINNPELRKEHYIEANILPSFEDTASQEPFTSRPDYEAWKTMIQGRTAPSYYIPPAHEVLQAFGQAVLDVLYDKADAQTALDQAAAQIDEILAQYE